MCHSHDEHDLHFDGSGKDWRKWKELRIKTKELNVVLRAVGSNVVTGNYVYCNGSQLVKLGIWVWNWISWTRLNYLLTKTLTSFPNSVLFSPCPAHMGRVLDAPLEVSWSRWSKPVCDGSAALSMLHLTNNNPARRTAGQTWSTQSWQWESDAK